MAYVATLHKPGRTYDAIVTDFLEPDVPNLILIKLDHIEIYSLPAPSKLLQTIETHTVLLSCIANKPASSPTSHLFLSTPFFAYFSLSWDPITKTAVTSESFLDTSERFVRAAETPNLIVDPQKRCIASHSAQGVLHIFNIRRNVEGFKAVSEKALGRIEAPERARFGEFKTGDMVFLEATEGVDQGGKERVIVVVGVVDPISGYWGTKAYSWAFKKTREGIPPLDEVEKWGIVPGGEVKVEGGDDTVMVRILPVAGKYGGYVAVGPRIAVYKPDPSSHEAVVTKTMSRLERGIEAWCKLDDERFLVGDAAGGLSILLLEINEKYQKVKGLRLIPLGNTPPVNKIVDLKRGSLYFIASLSADMQIIELAKTKPHIKVIQTFTNFAPLLDLAIPELAFAGREQKLESYLPGQSRVVAATGWEHTGCIRSIRSGIGLDVDGEVDLFGATQAWGMKKSRSDEYNDALIVGFVDETRVFGLDEEGGLEELAEYPGLKLNVETLLAGEFGQYRVQVTRKDVSFYDISQGIEAGIWDATTHAGCQEILFAAANDRYVIVGLNGNKAITLGIEAGGFKLQAEVTWPDSPACVAIAPGDSAVAAVGFWGAGKVDLLDCRTLATLSTDPLSGGEGSLPRSVLLGPMLETHPLSLLVGMGDGDLYSFVITEEGQLAQRSKTVVGLQSMGLYAIPREVSTGNSRTRKIGAFVASENPALLYANESGTRLVYSAIQSEEVVFATPFHSKAFQDTVLIGTGDSVRFIHLDKERTMHVETRSTRDEGVPRRIVYSPEHNILAVALTAFRIDSQGREILVSKIAIYGSTFLEKLDEMELNENEMVECIDTVVLPGSQNDGKDTECFVLGTALVDTESPSPRATMGRILVFEVLEGKKLGKRGAADKLGPCKTICKFEKKHCFLAGLNKSVSLIHYEPVEKLSETHFKFTKLASFRCHSEPIEISSIGDFIAVGDVFRGPSLVQLIRNTPDATSTSVDTTKEKAPVSAVDAASSTAKKVIVKPKPPFQMVEVARTYEHFWTTSCQMLDKDTIVAADTVGRVVIFTRNKDAVGEGEAMKLVKSCYYVGNDVVNRIKLLPDPSTSSPEATQTQSATSTNKNFYHPVLPRAHLITRNGAILLLSIIPPPLQPLLMTLQSHLAPPPPSTSNLKDTSKPKHPFRIRGPANISPFTNKKVGHYSSGLGDNSYAPATTGSSTSNENVNYERVVDGDLIVTQAWSVMTADERKVWLEGVLEELEKVRLGKGEEKMEVEGEEERKLGVEEVGWVLERLERLGG